MQKYIIYFYIFFILIFLFIFFENFYKKYFRNSYKKGSYLPYGPEWPSNRLSNYLKSNEEQRRKQMLEQGLIGSKSEYEVSENFHRNF